MALLLVSCASVQIKDAEFCGDMGRDGATCFHSLTTQTRDLNPRQWMDVRYGQICTSAKNFADWKSAIEKLCSISKRCTYELKQSVQNFMTNVNKISKDTN